MSDKPEQRKSLVTTMPAILTGAAALIAAITTSVVNLRGDKDEDASVAASATQPAATAPAKPVAGNPDHLQLRVARIAVHSDGTAGTTDWRFAVEVADEPRFAFEQDRLTDEGGRNIAVPTHDPTDVVLKPDRPLKLVVKGWKRSRLHAASPVPDAIGEGRILVDGHIDPIPVNAGAPDDGAFTFYFVADDGKGAKPASGGGSR